MKKFLLLFTFILIRICADAQVYSGGGGAIIQVTDTSRFDIPVSGLSPANIDTTFGLVSITINISHTSDRDIDCYIASPDGSMFSLTTDNGSTGDNYTNTVFRWDAATSITSGGAPFNGTYKPEGDIWRLNNGQNGNGTWQLRIIDDSWNTSTGSLINWSITFGNNPPHPFIFSSSNLPILVINTNGQTIQDDPKIIVDMGLIDNGTGNRNHLTDPYNNYNGKIAVEYRGSSSQGFPKKSMGFETRTTANTAVDTNVSLLGMPEEHDWILNANYSDKSFMHNFLAYQLHTEFGHWAPRCKFVDVVLNGEYWGIYVLMESIKWDDGRVDINHLRSNENTYPEITGGYIIKIDKQTGSGGAGWASNYPPINHPNGQEIFYLYDYPSPDSISFQQQSYIQAYVDSFESSLFGPNYMDSALGYMQYIGNKSFIDYFISNELSKNVDGYRISSYLYKDRSKTLKAGPVWDYDIAFGNADYCGGDDTLGWAYQFPCTGDYYQIPAWWPRMLTDSNYTNQLKCRWSLLRQGILSQQHLYDIIDSVAAYLDESQAWNFEKWPILGIYVWPNVAPYPTTYAGEVANLKTWLATRLQWLDANIPGNCDCGLTVSSVDATCGSTCDGEAIAAGSSVYPITYNWDHGSQEDTLLSLCTGTYILTMEDAVGCQQIDTIIISTSASNMTASVSINNTTCGGCDGTAAAHVSGGSGTYTYLWSNGLTQDSIFDLCPGGYSVTIDDGGNCPVVRNAFIAGSGQVTTAVTSTDISCNGICNGTATVNPTFGTPPFTWFWQPGGATTSTVNNLCAGTYYIVTTDSGGCQKFDTVTIAEPPLLTASVASVTHLLCNGGNNGSATINAGGGTGSYTYDWNPSGGTSSTATNLTAGNYIVTVTDANNCTDTVHVSITEPGSITLFTSSTPASCGISNGTATCSPSGGVPPYTYAWSPTGGNSSSAINLAAGNYTVTVTDSNNCIQSANVAVNNVGSPVISATVNSNVLCNGGSTGSAAVTVLSGNPPYTYSWSPSGGNAPAANNLVAGNYVVTVTDANNCISTENIVITEPPAISLNLQISHVTCRGYCDGTAATQVSGGTSGYSYSWCNSSTDSVISGLCAGNCSVTITDANGCIESQNFSITQPATAMTVSTFHTDATCLTCPDGTASATVNGGNSPYTYLWNTIPVQTTSFIQNLFPGIYTVCITDVNNCTVCDSVQVLDGSVGVNELPVNSSPVYVYPNPLSSSTTFVFQLGEKQHVSLSVFDTRGKLIRDLANEVFPAGDYLIEMNASTVSEGVYFFRFLTEERIQQGSLIIQR